MTNKNYHIGLDIGTSSVGFAVRYDNGELVHKKGSNLIGARLFKEGETAEERRLNRGARRRYNRRKWRLNLLNQIFRPLIEKEDPTFFKRLQDSNLINEDKEEQFRLWHDRDDDKFYQEFPTIYHLRNYLMTSTEKVDIKLIYLAVHHIIKYRGNFLDASPVDSFQASDLKVEEILTQINLLLDNLTDDLRLNIEKVDEIEQLLLNDNISRNDKQKPFQELLLTKDASKSDKNRIKLLVKLFLGLKIDVKNLFKIETELQNPKLELSSANSDEVMGLLNEELDEDKFGILLQAKVLYSRVRLNQIIPSGTTLSESMIQKYDLHHEQLKSFKENILLKLPRKAIIRRNLELAYALYIGNAQTKAGIFDAKQAKFTSEDFNNLRESIGPLKSVIKEAPKNTKTKLTQSEFYDVLNNLFDKFKSELSLDTSIIEEIKKIKVAISDENYLLKQRTDQNGNIPHQLHQSELRKILENQLPYYPELDQINKEKPLEKLVTFRVPYYVGPLITPEDQQKSSNATFAWMKRKSNGEITPWNFDEKVNRMESATNFIKRMTVKDTYLLNEDVLPDRSLLYQRFKVLNELNLIKVNDRFLSVSDKQAVYNDLFKNYKTVSVKRMKNYLTSELNYSGNLTITGLADVDKFNNGLTTYIDFKHIFGDAIEDSDKQREFEQIIEWSTVFEDRAIFEDKLKELDWITPDQIKSLVNKRYSGWGRLSYRLLAELTNENGERIIDILWNNSKINFMSVVSQDVFQEQISKINGKEVQELGMETVLANAYTSPQNKKAIRQVMKVVEDIQLAMKGQVPSSISIEFTRKPDDNAEISKSRYDTINGLYKNISKDIEKEVRDNLKENSYLKKNLSDKYYLYFMQLGRDIYTNKPIPFDDVPYYDIDHIVPRSIEMNDSLSNRVLVHKNINQIKKNNAPVDSSLTITTEVRELWKKLLDLGLINKQKYYKLNNSIKDKISPYVKQGFINRQLVETSQVIKLVANILDTKYQNDDTEIIEVKAHFNSEIRKTFGFYKMRELNDYHHGFDAYLTTLVGGYLYNRYPKLRSYFIYGDHKRLDKIQLNELKTFNFLHDFISPDKNSDGLIKAPGTQEVVLDRNKTIERLNQIYRYKYMLISREVFTKQGQFYNETVYPAKPETSKMIPLKQTKPSEIYGGYSSNNDAYIALIKEDEDNYRFVGIPIRFVDKLKVAKKQGQEIYNNQLNYVIQTVLKSAMSSKKKLPQFEVILDKVMYNQVIVDQGQKYYLGSAYYKKNAKQLVISPSSIEILANKKTVKLSDEEISKNLIIVYKEIIDVLNQHFALYDINNVREKLNEGIEEFSNLPNYNMTTQDKFDITKPTKYGVIMRILSGIKNQTSVVKEIKVTTPLNKMQVKSGIKVSPEAKIYYTSPTGIFSHYKRVKDL